MRYMTLYAVGRRLAVLRIYARLGEHWRILECLETPIYQVPYGLIEERNFLSLSLSETYFSLLDSYVLSYQIGVLLVSKN